MASVQWDRCVIAAACAVALVVSGPARAAQPEGEAAVSEDLSEQATGHVVKAVEHYNNARYSDAEEEFNRAAYFAPKWRPLHFNLGVVAEAQGKLATAVTHYRDFRPYGSPEEQMMVDQRIDELTGRKAKIARAFKRQIAVSATALTLGLGGLAGGVVLFVLVGKRKDEAKEYDKAAQMLTDAGMSEQAAAYMAIADEKESQAGKYLYGGVYLGLFGLLAAVYSFLPLTKAIKSKRQLDGITLGPTRLKWNGGVGATLRF